MGQLGFFDADKRLQALSARGDPLEAIDHLVPWESFRAEIEAGVLTADELKKSSAGRKPFDAILMFRMLVLQATSRWNIRCATGCRSRAFWGSRSRTAFRTPRRFGCSARSWPRPGSSRSCLTATSILRPRATWPWWTDHRRQYRAGADAAEQS